MPTNLKEVERGVSFQLESRKDTKYLSGKNLKEALKEARDWSESRKQQHYFLKKTVTRTVAIFRNGRRIK